MSKHPNNLDTKESQETLDLVRDLKNKLTIFSTTVYYATSLTEEELIEVDFKIEKELAKFERREAKFLPKGSKNIAEGIRNKTDKLSRIVFDEQFISKRNDEYFAWLTAKVEEEADRIDTLEKERIREGDVRMQREKTKSVLSGGLPVNPALPAPKRISVIRLERKQEFEKLMNAFEELKNLEERVYTKRGMEFLSKLEPSFKKQADRIINNLNQSVAYSGYSTELDRLIAVIQSNEGKMSKKYFIKLTSELKKKIKFIKQLEKNAESLSIVPPSIKDIEDIEDELFSPNYIKNNIKRRISDFRMFLSKKGVKISLDSIKDLFKWMNEYSLLLSSSNKGISEIPEEKQYMLGAYITKFNLSLNKTEDLLQNYDGPIELLIRLEQEMTKRLNETEEEIKECEKIKENTKKDLDDLAQVLKEQSKYLKEGDLSVLNDRCIQYYIDLLGGQTSSIKPVDLDSIVSEIARLKDFVYDYNDYIGILTDLQEAIKEERVLIIEEREKVKENTKKDLDDLAQVLKKESEYIKEGNLPRFSEDGGIEGAGGGGSSNPPAGAKLPPVVVPPHKRLPKITTPPRGEIEASIPTKSTVEFVKPRVDLPPVSTPPRREIEEDDLEEDVRPTLVSAEEEDRPTAIIPLEPKKGRLMENVDKKEDEVREGLKEDIINNLDELALILDEKIREISREELAHVDEFLQYHISILEKGELPSERDSIGAQTHLIFSIDQLKILIRSYNDESNVLGIIKDGLNKKIAALKDTDDYMTVEDKDIVNNGVNLPRFSEDGGIEGAGGGGSSNPPAGAKLPPVVVPPHKRLPKITTPPRGEIEASIPPKSTVEFVKPRVILPPVSTPPRREIEDDLEEDVRPTLVSAEEDDRLTAIIPSEPKKWGQIKNKTGQTFLGKLIRSGRNIYTYITGNLTKSILKEMEQEDALNVDKMLKEVNSVKKIVEDIADLLKSYHKKDDSWEDGTMPDRIPDVFGQFNLKEILEGFDDFKNKLSRVKTKKDLYEFLKTQSNLIENIKRAIEIYEKYKNISPYSKNGIPILMSHLKLFKDSFDHIAKDNDIPL